MSQTPSENDEASCISISGALSLHETASIRKTLINRMADGDEFTLNLRDITDCDTAGIQLLISAYHSARLQGKSVTVSGLSESVRIAAERAGFNPERFLSDEEKGK